MVSAVLPPRPDLAEEAPAPWELDVIQKGAAAAKRCAAPVNGKMDAADDQQRRRQPPAVAFCVAGAARSFATPVVQMHLQHNLIRPSVGSDLSSTASRLFLQLKLLDSRKIVRSSGQPFHQHKESTLASILAALGQRWMAPLIGEALVLNGSGSVDVTTVGCKRASSECVVQPMADGWRDYRIRACLGDQSNTERSRTMHHGGASAGTHSRHHHGNRSELMGIGRNSSKAISTSRVGECCTPRNAWLDDGNNEERLILQHLAIAWCGEAIPRYELTWGRSFDMVVLTRPDAIWWQPVVPWCEWRWWEHMISCDAPMCDMAWLAPRRHLERLTAQHLMHRDCPAYRDRRDGRHGCCTTSEHLLAFARVHRNATHRARDEVSLSPVGGPLRFMGVLRSVGGACNVVLSHKIDTPPGAKPTAAAGRFVFTQQTRHGLMSSTLVKLRKLFVRNESGVARNMSLPSLAEEWRNCRLALGFYGEPSHPFPAEVQTAQKGQKPMKSRGRR